MSCIAPIKLKEMDRVVPCGGCNFCLSRRRSDWSVRLFKEHCVSNSSFFITLTYDEEHIVYGNEIFGTLNKLDLMRFHENMKLTQKRLIKNGKAKKTQKRIKYYAVGEYGSETRRPHYHTIMFNCNMQTIQKLADNKIWIKGMVHIGSVTNASINYVTKYVIDRDMLTKDQKPFSLMSKGLGEDYLQSNSKWHTGETLKGFMRHNGTTVAMPRYYRDKIFTKEEKEWMNEKGIKELDNKFFEELDRLESMGVYRPMDYES